MNQWGDAGSFRVRTNGIAGTTPSGELTESHNLVRLITNEANYDLI